MLTEWPENIAMYGLSEHINKAFQRTSIYFQEDNKSLSKELQSILDELNKAAGLGELNSYPALLGHHRRIHDRETTLFFPAEEVITWALLKGYRLPENVQSMLGIHQINKPSLTKSGQNSLRNKFVGQMIHQLFPLLKVDEIRDHDLMKKFGTLSFDKTRREIYRDLLNVFAIESGQKGVKTEITQPLRPIDGVVLEEVECSNRYCFQSLGMIMDIAAKIKIETEFNTISKMTVEEFLELVIKDTVVSMYLKGASGGTLTYSGLICRKAFEPLSFCSNYFKGTQQAGKEIIIGVQQTINLDYFNRTLRSLH